MPKGTGTEPPLSDKCQLLIKEAHNMEKSEGLRCLPKESLKSLVMCESKRARIEEGSDFSESMKKGWALGKKVKCQEK